MLEGMKNLIGRELLRADMISDWEGGGLRADIIWEEAN